MVERLLWTTVVVLPVFAVVAALLVVRSYSSGPSVPNGAVIEDFVATPVAEDRPAPSFDLPSLTGTGSTSLARFRGHVVVLNLWASWCDPCRAEAPALEQVSKGNRDVVVLGVDHRDAHGDAIAFRGRFGLTYPMVSDPKGSVASAYGAIGLPTTFVIDPSGRIRYRLLGRVTVRVLEPLLRRIASPG
jgi:cytochrome c biogenesis protein CcmG/thiol:disulfide interchange protein DsbE